MKDIRAQLAAFFRKSGFDIDVDRLDRFAAFHALLEKYNESHDLSRLHRFEDIAVKHYIDSIYITKLCDIPSPIMDIGTGAGFPGIPLAITLPEKYFVLAEPRYKRVEFLRIAIAELGLANVEVYPHTVTDKTFVKVNGIITRALESVGDTLERVNHFLPAGGLVLFMKGPAADADKEQVPDRVMLNYEGAGDIAYTIPGTSYERRLLIYRKKSSFMKVTYIIDKEGKASAGTAIASPDNKRYKDLKRLMDADGVRKTGMTLVSGKKQVLETAGRHRDLCEVLVIHDGFAEDSAEMNNLIDEYAAGRKLFILKKSLYNELDLFNTGGPLLAVRTPEIVEWDMKPAAGCTLLIPFQDPSNVGAVIRSALAFGVGRMVLLREAAHPFHPRSVRSSGGTVFSAPLYRGPSINDIEAACDAGTILLCLDSGGRSLVDFSFPENFMLLPGLEGPGLPDGLRREAVSIPIDEKVESLNATVAASIALFAWRSQKR